MRLKSLVTELMVEDVDKTVDFYVNILGFNLINKVGEEKMVWADVKYQESEIELMFITKESLTEDIKEFSGVKIGGSIALFIEVNEINDLYEKVKNRVKIIKEINKTFYGTKEFVIKDINGYVLIFAER